MCSLIYLLSQTCLAEPSSAPTITVVMVLNSTSVLLEWKAVAVESRLGIITQYTIHYKDVEKEKEGTIVVKAPVLRAIINGLRQQAEYTFWIFAATSKGNGPASNSKKATTAGKRSKKAPL